MIVNDGERSENTDCVGELLFIHVLKGEMNYVLHNVDASWKEVLKQQINEVYFKELLLFLETEYEEKKIFPRKDQIFRALEATPFHSVKAVILGQDPYHGDNQAEGLSFSVSKGMKLPPSLRNIFAELHDDLGCTPPKEGSLIKWADEGVLLLNTVLTVRKGEPNSHKGEGWEHFTDEIIRLLNDRKEPLVFLLWGKHAQKKKELLSSSHHLIIESPHPSPFAARKGFFGSKPFSRTNVFLKEQGINEIDWCLED